MRFAREILTDALLDEMAPLLAAHWSEIAHYPDIPLNVDRAMYLDAEARDALYVFTVREDGRLVREGGRFVRDAATLLGYAVFFVRANPHYSSSVQAVQDVIYVSPTARGSTGARLIRFADEALKAKGVQAVYHHVKTAHNWGKMLERMGYEAVDVIYAKRLDRG